MVGSLQDWSQLNASYGRDDAETLLCFRNYVILAAANAKNAGMASEILGSHDVKRWRKSYTAGKLTRTEEVTRDEPVVQASEISNLPDLVAYVKFGEDFPDHQGEDAIHRLQRARPGNHDHRSSRVTR